MKHSMQSLDNAINFLVPEIAIAKSEGVTFNRPELVKMVACQYFQESFDSDWNPSYDERIAYYICQEAFVSLNEDGFFTFGEMVYEFNK